MLIKQFLLYILIFFIHWLSLMGVAQALGLVGLTPEPSLDLESGAFEGDQ